MNQLQKLKFCNWSLLVFCLGIFASGIQLEATGSRGIGAVWVHVFVGLVFSGLVFWHVYLHFKRGNWFKRFQKLKKPVTRILWYLFLLTLFLGVAAFIRWLSFQGHSVLGGVHGKIGFIMMMFAIAHLIKRIKFFRKF